MPAITTVASGALDEVEIDEASDFAALLPTAARLMARDLMPELAAGLQLLEERMGAVGDPTELLALFADEVKARRLTLRWGFPSGALSGSATVAWSVRDPDPPTQEWALAEVVPRLSESDRTEALVTLSQQGRSRVRVRALGSLWEMNGELALNLTRDALLSSSPSERAFATGKLRTESDLDPRAFYLASVDGVSGRTLAGALAEIGRWGSLEDAQIVSRYLTAEQSNRVLTAALRATCQLNPERARPHYATAIASESRRVSRTARDLVIDDSAFGACDFAIKWTRDLGPLHSRQNALRIAEHRCPRFERLIHLLDTYRTAPGELAEYALDGIRRWIDRSNRGSLQASEDEVRRVEAMLGLRLPDSIREQLAFLMRTLK